jgi:glycosyltransferase involved in cell wall biosynthesis
LGVTTDKPVLFLDATPWYGGAQRSLLTLVTGLRESGYLPVVLAADRSPGGLLDSCRVAGIAQGAIPARHWRFTAGGMAAFLADWWRFGLVFRRVCHACRPVLVHCNGVRAALLTAGRLPPSLPLVLHVRDVRMAELPRRMAARRAHRIVAVSECVAATFRALVGGGKVSVIPNGFDLDAIRQALPVDAVAAAGEHCLAVLVADMVDWKRHDLFIEAVHCARARVPGLRAVIVGRPLTRVGNRLLADLRRRATALGVGDTVRFVTDAADALPWIAAADMLVSTADCEPFGRTVVEALALGKPVVAVRGGGPDTVLAGTAAGVLVDATAAAVAEGIARWGLRCDREAVAFEARQRAERFDKARMVGQVAALYEALLRARAGA